MAHITKYFVVAFITILLLGMESLTAFQLLEAARLVKYKYDAINLILKEDARAGNYLFFADGRVFKLLEYKEENTRRYAVLHREEDDRLLRLPLPCN